MPGSSDWQEVSQNEEPRSFGAPHFNASTKKAPGDLLRGPGLCLSVRPSNFCFCSLPNQQQNLRSILVSSQILAELTARPVYIDVDGP